jgi:hypothetical protein
MKNKTAHKIVKKVAKLVGLSPVQRDEVTDIVGNLVSLEDYRNKIRGVDGEQGEKGENGETGERGPQGISGNVGPTGAEGRLGVQGKKGISGSDGRRGRLGLTGPTGPRGSKGDKGDTGPAPDHEWNGSRLRFRNPNGGWGIFVNLQGMVGGRGRSGAEGFSVKQLWESITLVGSDLVFAKPKAGALGEEITVDLSGLSASSSWGSITGTLSAQTDLQAELDRTRTMRYFLGE